MKFLVINGSPKGDYSVTLQTLLYAKKIFKEHEFEVINVGQKINYYKNNIYEATNKLKDCDVIIFSYPVYTFIAPSQLHQFIRLLKESNVNLSGKYVTQFTTSKHFYDITAHKYIEENCFDMNMKVIKGLSADMEDLTKKNGQQDAINFINFVINSVNNDIYEPIVKYDESITNYSSSLENVNKSEEKDIVIVADIKDDDTNLKEMVKDFQNSLKYKTRIININEFKFHGGCLGCFNCAGSGKCVYKDNFDTFLREKIQTADAIIIAFTIQDHSMGVQFKLYDDRQFCNGHRTVTENMPFAYIINGNYENEHNLKMIIEARAEVGHNYLAGVCVDKNSIVATTKKLEYAIDNKYVLPRNFYGVGGMKIFRDLIWIMRGIMKADHVFYKKHGVYDFPQKQRGKMLLMCLLGSMVRNEKIKAKMGNKFNEGMIAPYKKVIDKLDKEK